MDEILFVITYCTQILLVLIISSIIVLLIPFLQEYAFTKICMYIALVTVWIGEIALMIKILKVAKR